MRRGLLCTNHHKGSIAAISNTWKNTVCMDNIYIKYVSVINNVEKFICFGHNIWQPYQIQFVNMADC